jgi:tripeptide aminopeptidase
MRSDTVVVDLFCELAAIPSPPGRERAVADRVARFLAELGVTVDEDDAGGRVGAAAGNLYARIPAVAPGEPLLFCAHLDTVPAVAPIEPELVDGAIRNRAPAILGADDKAAVAVMLEAVRRVLAEQRPHAGIELLFTPKEEVGLLGAYAFDHTRLHARMGFVYDQAAPIGTVIVGAPFRRELEVELHGTAAHAGMHARDGRSAIAAAADAIARMRLGQVDELTTANVGTIDGGTAINVVPERCAFTAEVRSHEPERLVRVLGEMRCAIEVAAADAQCRADLRERKSYDGYRFGERDRPVALAARALERCGFGVSYALSGGAADANAFNERGLQVVNLANGMIDIHTPDERIAVRDLEAMVDVTLALVDEALAR